MKASMCLPSSDRLSSVGLIPLMLLLAGVAGVPMLHVNNAAAGDLVRNDLASNDLMQWQMHGFVTQAAFHSSDNNFNGESDDGISTDFNEAGLNASVSLFGNVRIAGQALARNAGEYDRGDLRTDYFNIDWKFWQGESFIAGARVGRVRNPYGLYNETRDVAHTRPSIYLPGVVYIESIRDVLISRDGYAFYGELYGDFGTLSLEGGAGEHQVSDNLIAEAMLADIGSIKITNAQMKIARAMWESPDARWRLALSATSYEDDADYVVPGTFSQVVTVASLQYSTSQWQLTSEFLRFDFDLDAGPLQLKRPGEAAYLQYNWFFSPQWQVYGRYEYGVWDRDHRNGSSMQQFCGTLFEQFCYPRQTGYRRDAGLGVRWDIDNHWMIAAEAHYLEGTMMLSYLDNRDTFATATYWTLLGLEVAFRF